MVEASTINRAQSAVLIMDYQYDIVSNVEASYPGLLDRAASVLSAARRADAVGGKGCLIFLYSKSS